MRSLLTCVLTLLLVIGTFSCAARTPPPQENEMTLGVVQKEVREGMSQADVAAALGSPNIVTKDSDGNESWIYDKISSEATYSQQSGYGTLIFFGGSSRSGKATTVQKTLTVVLKFDKAGKVRNISYHSSKF